MAIVELCRTEYINGDSYSKIYVDVDVEDNVDEDEDLAVESKLGKQSRQWWV